MDLNRELDILLEQRAELDKRIKEIFRELRRKENKEKKVKS